MKHQLDDSVGLRRLNIEPIGSQASLNRIERSLMQRIDRPVSRLRALAVTNPAGVLAVCLVGGVAFGASAVVALDQFGISIVRSGDQEYLSVPAPDTRERALLPVESGEGQELVQRLQAGSRLLHSVDGGQSANSGVAARAPRRFKVDSSAVGQNTGMLIQTPDGKQVRVRPIEDGDR